MYEFNYLAHYGVLGMRWGIRRYQNRDGSLTAEGRRHVGLKNDSPRHTPSKARKAAKEKAKALEKARKAKEEKRIYEEQKAEALKKGTAKDLLKYKGDLTNKELSDALSRIDYEKKLSTIAASETKTAWDKMDAFVNKATKIKGYAEKGIDVYNLMAKVHNSLVDEDDAWTVLDGKSQRKETKEDKRLAKLVKTGTAEEILKKADRLSTSQLTEAIKRLNSKKTLSSF